MKKHLLAFFVLLLAVTTIVGQDVINNKDKPEYLYVLSAKSGSFDDGTLTLNNVPMVIYFSDRPYRIAGHISLKKFVENWNKGSDSFMADPPNATLSILGVDRNTNVVIEISAPVIKQDIVIFKVRILEGSLPMKFANASLFVDIVNFNGPASLGGVF